MLLAAAMAGADSHPAQAAGCIAQPNMQAPDGTHWTLHHDHIRNRRCWLLVDSAGREVAPVPAQPAGTSMSAWQAFLGNFTGAGTPPQRPQAAPASHGPESRIVTASKPARTAPPKTEVHLAKPQLSQEERDALFEEFLRWHESQKITGAK
jgi:hypothetical protein